MLEPLDEVALTELVTDAVRDTAIGDVMPVTRGPEEWTPARLEEFVDFHRARRGGLEGPTREVTFVVRVGGRASGVIRLQRVSAGALEVGMWLARSVRGRGVGGRALAEAARRAVGLGAERLVAETEASNDVALAALRRIGADISVQSETGGVHAEMDLATFTS